MATREDIDIDLVVHGIVQAVGASMSHHGAMRCAIVDATGRTTERWHEFADGIAQVYQTRRENRSGGRAMYNVGELEDLILRLRRFMRADVARSDRTATVAGPVPHASARVAYATLTAASDQHVAPPPPPPPVSFTSREDLALAPHTSLADISQ
jgi:hypothetical protein